MKFLVVQTAFIGDVVLATPIVEKLRQFYPHARIDFLLRKGNESLLIGHPHIQKCWVWNKKQAKYSGLFKLIWQLRQEQYDCVINCQRFAAAGLLTVLSGARQTVGFSKNPFSSLFSRRLPHVLGAAQNAVHEVDRNLSLIQHLTDESFVNPALYPSQQDYETIRQFVPKDRNYVCVAPTSVWFTKQYPATKWVILLKQLVKKHTVFLLGGPSDEAACAQIVAAVDHPAIHNLSGQLSFLESAALMQKAAMNYVNDSAPMHFASAVNAPVSAVFCSTVPQFGFTPLSEVQHIIEIKDPLSCRPCGLHGRRSCPEGHFACAMSIDWRQFPIPE